ncbi:hypothetical protein C7B61_16995 [filamentous cyanobacterium CCP1]|nr:hypothetical protein C7B76_14455 [filamentous cyanobacterium CCP2]PSB60740.1 hypothetical protein C7B61_16995 [filamentous cyanobacterium CCP1]
MNSNTTQSEQNGYRSSVPQWREASPCEPVCPPSRPDKPDLDKPCPDKPCSDKPDPVTKCTEIIREKDSKETYFLVNTDRNEKNTEKNSDSLSKLAWFLLGLTGLLLLGSMLSNLLVVWALANSNNTQSREVITTTTTDREIQVVEKVGYDEYYYYAPPARW